MTEAKATSASGRVISDLQYLYDKDGNVIATADGDQNLLTSITSIYAGDGVLTINTYDGDEVTEAKAISASSRMMRSLVIA